GAQRRDAIERVAAARSRHLLLVARPHLHGRVSQRDGVESVLDLGDGIDRLRVALARRLLLRLHAGVISGGLAVLREQDGGGADQDDDDADQDELDWLAHGVSFAGGPGSLVDSRGAGPASRPRITWVLHSRSGSPREGGTTG